MATKKTNKPHGNRKDISGQRFGRFTVIQCAGPRRSKLLWECLCDCGVTKLVIGSNLTRGRSVSCGCYLIESVTKHGKARSSEYHTWAAAKDRCFNPDSRSYANYGLRGISMCSEWRESFEAFYSYIGPRPDGASLDRIDNDGDYEPGNVRWATDRTQVRNRRITVHATHEGETLSLAEWAERTGIAYGTLMCRYLGLNKTPLLAPLTPRGQNSKRKQGPRIG